MRKAGAEWRKIARHAVSCATVLFRVYLSLVAVHSLAENHSDNSSPRRLAVKDYAHSRRQHRFKSGRGYDGQLFEVATPAKLGCGVIGNTADSGSAILGSSPGIPANEPSQMRGFFVFRTCLFTSLWAVG